VNAVVGTLIGGVLLFISSIFVPIISKKLNKATDAASSAEKISVGAEKNAGMALRIAEDLERKVVTAETRCNECLGELGLMRRRADKRDRALDAIHTALLEIVPLLHANPDATKMLRATIRTVKQARYSED
jgi:predicted metal-binding protein